VRNVKLSLLQALHDAAEDVEKAADAGVSPGQFLAGSGFTYGGGQPLKTDWDQDKAILEGYKGSTWPFACLDRLGGACSSVPWRVMEKKRGGPKPPGRGMSSSGEWEAQDGHPRELLIERPNDYMSRQFLINIMVLHLGTVGNALLKQIYVTRKGQLEPDDLWPIGRYRPVPVDEFAAPRIGPDGKQVVWIEGYRRYDRPMLPILPPTQVVHAMLPDPGNLLWGMSPMRPVAPIIDMDRKQVAWNGSLPEQANVPRGAFVDRNLKTDGQMREAARLLQARMADRTGVPLVIGAGSEYLRMALTPVETDWNESRKISMIEICAAYGVLPSLFISDSKYANQETAVKHMWKNGAHRMLSVIEDAFNLKLVPRARRGEMWIHFDLSQVPDIQDTLPQRLEAHARAVGAGVPINRSIVMLDIPVDRVEGGDEPLVSSLLIPLEQLLETPDPPGVDDGTDDLSPDPAPAATPKPNGAESGKNGSKPAAAPAPS